MSQKLIFKILSGKAVYSDRAYGNDRPAKMKEEKPVSSHL
jgi:hypothetical protein